MRPQFGTVFLDRDGVLNRKKPAGSYVRSYKEFQWLPGSREALRLLEGRHLIVVTNQRGIARGHMTWDDVVDIHRRMEADLWRCGVQLAGIYVCPHEEGTCECRKPKPGMIRRAAVEVKGLDLTDAIMIGDSISDLEVAADVGCPCVLVASGLHRERTLTRAKAAGLPVLHIASSLLKAARQLVQRSGVDAIAPNRCRR